MKTLITILAWSFLALALDACAKLKAPPEHDGPAWTAKGVVYEK